MECKFAVNQLSFDLCPLFNSVSAAFEVSIDEDTPPTHTKNVYVMNFNKPLAWDGTLPAELQKELVYA
ncbi:hypothetical protein H0H87_005687 [Tephrocybe sp. NHM501043]|nr:hypothetical protein H0H87_005687 [Tephrocybe sp. NHM501043]